MQDKIEAAQGCTFSVAINELGTRDSKEHGPDTPALEILKVSPDAVLL